MILGFAILVLLFVVTADVTLVAAVATAALTLTLVAAFVVAVA